MQLTPSERIIVISLAAINFTHIMDSMIMMPLGDIFMRLFEIGPGQFSLLVSSYAIAAFLSSLLAVFYLDTFDRKRGLLIIYAGFTFGTILCGFAPSYPFLLAIRFTTGLFGGVIGAMALSIISDVFPFERRGKAMGYLMAGFSGAAALGVPRLTGIPLELPGIDKFLELALETGQRYNMEHQALVEAAVYPDAAQPHPPRTCQPCCDGSFIPLTVNAVHPYSPLLKG